MHWGFVVSVAVRELRLSDQLMLEELVDAVTLDVTGRGATNALAPVGSGATAFLTDGNSFAYAAYLDNEVAGGFWGVRIRHPNGSVSVEVIDLHVLPAARRQGIGSLLIESAVAHARRAGATDLVMRAGSDLGTVANGMAAVSDPDRGLVRWTFD